MGEKKEVNLGAIQPEATRNKRNKVKAAEFEDILKEKETPKCQQAKMEEEDYRKAVEAEEKKTSNKLQQKSSKKNNKRLDKEGENKGNILHRESNEWRNKNNEKNTTQGEEKELNPIASRTRLEEDMQKGNAEGKNHGITLKDKETGNNEIWPRLVKTMEE